MVVATTLHESYAPVNFNKNNNHGFRKDNPVFDDDHHHGASVVKQLIGDALRSRVENIDHEACEPGDEDTFFVGDLGEVYRQYVRWKLNLPRVKPFYAVKCNPDPKVLQLLASLGTGFDCASKWEVEQALATGVAPARVIYAQPCKTNSYVRFVRSRGVRQMTFDNADELRKIAKLFPDAELLLRIHTDDSSSLCRLSVKFGASLESTDELLALAKDLGLNIVGVSFHVGSGASDPLAFLRPVQDADLVFRRAAAYGFDMKTLDVGGGFSTDARFEEAAGVLAAALDEYFPPHRGVGLIAEPGRYFVSSAFTLACNVIARRTIHNPAGAAAAAATSRYMLYVNDGVYGNFSSIMFDHQHPEARILRAGSRTLYNTAAALPSPSCPPDSEDDEAAAAAARGTEYSIWGPTCDGIDRITESIRFGTVLDVGDWLYFENMGAYTMCSATNFNGFPNGHDVIYICSEPGARALMEM